MSETDGKTELLQLLEPVLQKVASLDPASRGDEAAAADLEQALNQAFPPDGDTARAIAAAIDRGVAEGWLCNRGEPNARFSRLAKPTPQTHDLSIDVVALDGAAVRHTHPRGEVTLGHPAPGSSEAARFDGRPPGWVFCRPGSTHTPTVENGRMHLMYFLPGGAVEWH